MVKNKALTLIACFFSLNCYSETLIRVDISEQRLYLIKNEQILSSYPISSSSYGHHDLFTWMQQQHTNTMMV